MQSKGFLMKVLLVKITFQTFKDDLSTALNEQIFWAEWQQYKDASQIWKI